MTIEGDVERDGVIMVAGMMQCAGAKGGRFEVRRNRNWTDGNVLAQRRPLRGMNKAERD